METQPHKLSLNIEAATINRFKKSNVWDKRYDLPLVPLHNNPWIYSAYAMKIMGPSKEMRKRFEDHAERCEHLEAGLYDRWPRNPDGTSRGGMNSYDALLGMGFHSDILAKRINWYLHLNDGVYINEPKDMNTKVKERYNMYRFPFLKPFLRSRGGHRIGLVSDLIFAGFIMYDAIKYDGKDWSGRLRIWLMIDEMKKHPLSSLAIWHWKRKMKKYHVHPKRCFNHYLVECPVFSHTAPEEFI
jgi:hypothetical protein